MSNANDTNSKSSNEGRTAELLVKYGSAAELFHSERNEPFARLKVAKHVETWPIRSSGFHDWMARQYFLETGRVPNKQAVENATSLLEGKARWEGPEYRLSVRVAEDDGGLWYDLADSEWRGIRVTAEGWRIVKSPPPIFRRYLPFASQVEPVSGGSLESLRGFLNLRDEDAWYKLVVWLVASLFPSIAHPVLVVYGEQGSAKSTLCRILALLVHPSKTPLRSPPRDKTEWVQIADHSWLVTLDNISNIQQWLSDALCRAVTGDADSKRMLYTDADDYIFEFRRVISVTGIEVVAQRSDLLDRSLLMPLEPIESHERKSETEILKRFEVERPRIFGALLDLAVKVFQVLPEVQLDRLPRMADFAKIGVAVEIVSGWPVGAFMAAYDREITKQHEEALCGSMVGEAVLAFMDQTESWEGTASDLLYQLDSYGGTSHKPPGYPKTPQSLSGALRRIAPNLRALGIDAHFGTPHGRRLITLTRHSGPECVPTVPVDPTADLSPNRNGRNADSGRLSASAPADLDADYDSDPFAESDGPEVRI